MAYIDYTYYTETFKGQEIPMSEFDRLADVASDVVYAICINKPTGAVLLKTDFLRAVAYQIEFLYEQGGLESIYGRSDASQSDGSESLGNYSVSGNRMSSGTGTEGSQDAIKFFGGIPLSPLTLALLEKIGLMSQWVYAYRYPK